jgi:precorrin-3B C17-methyltransferase
MSAREQLSGRLAVVGLGPGAPDLLTPEASAELAAASDLVGYGPYLDRVPMRPGQRRHASDNRAEIARARHALTLAAAGKRVAVVSSGDPGVFAMASAVFEAIEAGEPQWRALDVVVLPGVSAMLAAAARLGAPLGHDFCVLSLSDNLKPWDLVLRRLEAAARADFVLALYNPASKARPWQLGEVFALLCRFKPAETPIAFATAISRPEERIEIVTLGEAEPARADMRTLVLVGSSMTRMIARAGARPWLYTPRRVRETAE